MINVSQIREQPKDNLVQYFKTACHNCRSDAEKGLCIHTAWNNLNLCRECAKDLFNEMQNSLPVWYR